MAGENEQPQHVRAARLQELIDGDQVAQGLAHLFARQLQHAVVHPIAGKGLAGQALALGDLVFVVGEDQVIAAAVDVDGLAQVMQTHGRAFDVPAGSAGSPRTFPRRFAWLGRLPQRKVAHKLLARVFLNAGAALGQVQFAPAQFAVVGVLAHPEVDVAVQFVGIAGLAQPLDHGDDLADLLAHARVDVRGQHVEIGQVLQVLLGVVIGQFHRIGAGFVGPADDLVVHIGKIGDVGDLVAAEREIAAHHVEDDGGHGMAHVRVGIDGRSAHVHADFALLDRLKRLLPAGECVINFKSHDWYPSVVWPAVGQRGNLTPTAPAIDGRDAKNPPRD